MTRLFGFSLAFVLLASGPGQASAWNSIGHMAVAKLAYDELGDGHKLKLFRLLSRHPHYHAFLGAGRPPEIDNEVQWVIMRAAVWPDWVRPRLKDSRSGVTKYHRSEDHYINIPFVDPKDEKEFAGKVLVSPDLANIVSALKQRANEVRTKTADDEEKAVALCWLFHLVGDIHQPLHNVAYFSSDKAYSQGDMGGNKFGIRAAGRTWKLHAFWDDLLGEDANYADDSALRQANLFHQAVKVAEGLRGRLLCENDKESLAKNVTFESWSRESFELARTVAYQKADGTGLLEGVPVGFSAPIPDGAPEVGPAYIERARATAERRVLLAGKRLATRVESLLGP